MCAMNVRRGQRTTCRCRQSGERWGDMGTISNRFSCGSPLPPTYKRRLTHLTSKGTTCLCIHCSPRGRRGKPSFTTSSWLLLSLAPRSHGNPTADHGGQENGSTPSNTHHNDATAPGNRMLQWGDQMASRRPTGTILVIGRPLRASHCMHTSPYALKSDPVQ